MSTGATGGGWVATSGLVPATAPMMRRVRAYFAPVNRATGQPTIFDAASSGAFPVDAPPAPWVDLGWCTGFLRKFDAGVKPLRTGAPQVAQAQTRAEIGATVAVGFESWGKLQMAVCSGSEQMNLLATATGAMANGSGGVAAAAAPLVSAGSTATALMVGAAGAGLFSVGDLVTVDVDYTGQTGYVGAGVSGAYVRSAADAANDVNYVRRVSLNVGRVVGIANGQLTLGAALPAGAPTAAMKVSRVMGFVDREGGRFFQEWSGLFCVAGEQGDQVLYHYPRLQAMESSTEMLEALTGGFERMRLAGAFRALPVVDANDGATVLCFRSYLPAAMRAI